MIDDPGNLVVGRVTGTAEPDQALIGHTEPLGHGHRVEVAMGGEDPPIGQAAADQGGRLAPDNKGERRRAGRTRRRPEKLYAFDRRSAHPRAVSRALYHARAASRTPPADARAA